ncbi:integrin alpha-9-like isoform X2 [Patiria miniata]|uniref:Integrin alpha-2 domain-containing protein n=1 Tax=Patiria miniata TaxID=46514 RepID=A0A913ZC97_PATMI|nr:integrin alpha-9-like isoform X2 [Patiria miniata]
MPLFLREVTLRMPTQGKSVRNTGRRCVARYCPGTEGRVAPWRLRTVYAGMGWRFVVLGLVWWCLLGVVRPFNLDTSAPVSYEGPSLSYFGYSVLLHENYAGKLLLVGAPTANSVHQLPLVRPGALYQCGLSSWRTALACQQVKLDDKGNERSLPGARPRFLDAKDNQWLGVSLTRQNIGPNGRVTVCGHRWSNDYYADAILPNGVCYSINAALDFTSVVKKRPCLNEIQIKSDANGRGIAWHGWCQAGFSAEYTADGETLMVGAVGSLAWRGSVVSIDNANTMTMSDVTTWYPTGEEDESYIGYAVTSGHFLSRSSTQGAVGAPRAYQRGKVYIYDLLDFTLLTQIKGQSMGTYFGAAVRGMDLNNDGLTDLLVGAPLYSVNQDEGRVYMYINDGNAIMRQLPETLSGSSMVNARFGSAIADGGDLNMDGFKDVVIGAPFEDDNSGAVYIYHGGETGLKTTFAQRLSGRTFTPHLKSFGSALSGGIDMDGNQYPDLLIGAHQSNRAVLYLSRPVIKMHASIVVKGTPIDLNRTTCVSEGRLVPCVRVVSCFMYSGVGLPENVAINYTLEADTLKRQTGLPGRVTFVENAVRRGSTISQNLQLRAGLPTCQDREAHIDVNMKDYLSPLPFRLTFDIRTTENSIGQPVTQCTGLCPMLDMYSPSKIIKQVGFIFNCGEDSVCETDLQLQATLLPKRGTPYIPYGNEENLFVEITLTNQGEEAHLAQVIVTHPEDITFVRVESDWRKETLVLCGPEKGENMTAKVVCDVDNPMRAFSKSFFRVKLFVPFLTNETTSIQVTAEATTTSTEANSTLYNNMVEMNLPVKIEADVTISGVTHPSEIIFGQKKKKEETSSGHETAGMDDVLTNLKKNTTGLEQDTINQASIGPKFKHIYDARNLGPSTIPYLTTVNISLPWKTKDGDWLLYFTHIELKGTGRCKYDHILQQQHKELQTYINTTNSKSSSLQFFSSGEALVVDCQTAQCATIFCMIDNLQMGEGAVIEIQARFYEKTLIESGYDTIKLRSLARVRVENHNSAHVQPPDGRPDSIVIQTVAFTESSVTTKNVPTWVLAVGILAGIMLLLVVILGMWKCGFFRRKQREEMQKLINDKEDETESLYHDGDVNHLKDPFQDDED